MTKKKHVIEGEIDKFPTHKIYLNIKHLEEGTYTLHIVHKNKIIRKTTFKK